MTKKKIIIGFTQPVVTHARFHKRVEALKKLGVKAKIISYQRDHYKGEKISDELVLLGTVPQRQYIRRIGRILLSLGKMRKSLYDVDIIYAFGLEMLAMAWLSTLPIQKRLKYVCEVGDVREIFLKNHLGAMTLRTLERFFIRRIDLLVVTSEAYLKGYYKAIQGFSYIPHQVIENKVDKTWFLGSSLNEQKRYSDKIHIGYFGLIRCEKSWKLLKKILDKAKDKIELTVRGIPRRIDSFYKDVKEYDTITYGGPYIVPDDLPAIYGQVDLVWTAHHHEEANLKWARANRFYESCFFQKPMIAQKNTQDGNVVSKYQLGLTIDLKNTEESVDRLVSLNWDDIEKWQNNIARLPNEVYTYTTEHEQLLAMIE